MQKTLGEIARLISGQVTGDAQTVITGISGIKEARKGDITFLANPKYLPLLKSSRASAVIAPHGVQTDIPVIQVDNPSLAFAKLTSLIVGAPEKQFPGVHKTAVIAKSVRLGKNVSVGPCAVIEGDVTVGDNTTIYGGVYVGYRTQIGVDCLIYPNVSIRERSIIEDRVIIHSGAVIGSDGFGFADIDGVHRKIPQTGIVHIEKDVEIGANVTVDRARFDKTLIGQGTKIDNLVQIAHNVQIGKNCIIVSQAGVAGSTIIGDNVVIAGQTGIAGHLTVGEGAIVAGKSGVIEDVPPKAKVWGYPAKPHLHAKRVNAALQKLPDYAKKIRELEEKIRKLEEKLRG